jgi:hypothetical protein
MPTTPMPSFEDVFRNLWDAKPIVCRSSGQAVESLPAPAAIILDVGACARCLIQSLTVCSAVRALGLWRRAQDRR